MGLPSGSSVGSSESVLTLATGQSLRLLFQAGTLTFDHQAGTLSLVVQKDNRDSQSQIENVKQLSGGERSYATLSLLIALGECLECPFRIMDEFDVFMDVVSRKVPPLDALTHAHTRVPRAAPSSVP